MTELLYFIYLFIFIFGGPYNKLKTEIELSKEDKENFLH